ncbi:hypothetical protein RZS08_38645, partial [Arthrospira platensis SPKY1]|nr:hypothetical protein [Arthrospira platensis SPKY1]
MRKRRSDGSGKRGLRTFQHLQPPRTAHRHQGAGGRYPEHGVQPEGLRQQSAPQTTHDARQPVTEHAVKRLPAPAQPAGEVVR